MYLSSHSFSQIITQALAEHCVVVVVHCTEASNI